MPVNAGIYGNVGAGVTPLEDPQNALLKALQIQQAKLQGQQAQQGMQDDQDLRQATMESGGDQNKLMQLLYGRGQYGKAAAVQKSMLDADKARTDMAKDKAATAKTLTETQAAQIAQHRDMLADVNDPQTAMQWAQIGRQSGVLDDAKYQLAVQNIQRAAASPEAFNAWKTQAALGATKFIEMNKPTYQTRNTGGSTDTIALPGLIGVPSMVNSVQNTQSPDNAASNARQAADAAAARAVQMRGQNMVDARAREAAGVASGAAIAEAGGPGQAAMVKQFGKAPPGYRWKPDGSAEAIPGGPADIKAGEAGAKSVAKRDAQIAQAESVLGTIRDAKGLTGYTTAGVGGMLSGVPATPARNLQAKLETVKANLGFDRLQQMRDNSPTGGALGAVAVQELTALQSTVASLDQLQSPPQLAKALEKIEGHYTRWLDIMKQADGGKGGASGGWGDTAKPAAGGLSAQEQKELDDLRARFGGRK